MKDYYHFSVNDFVADHYFQSWVWHPSEESNGFWRAWLDRHPDKLRDVEEARDLLQKLKVSNYTLSDQELADIWNNIKNSSETIRFRSTKPVARWWWYAAAAIVVLAGALFYTLSQEEKLQYITAYGERKSIVLPDSSTVILNANSRISFTANWDEKKAREVWLDGEGYFEVVHKRNHQPFIVKVDDGMAIEVLGTTFNVYHRTQDTKVVLNSGKIQLSVPTKSKDERILMTPGQLVEFKASKLTKRSVDANLYVAWTRNRLVLDHTSLGEIIQMLNDNYGIEVKVENPELLNQTVSGSIPMPTAEQSVEQIARAFRLKATRDQDVYWLKE